MKILSVVLYARECWRCHQEHLDGDACGWCGVWLVDFEPEHVPVPLRWLLGPARRWGISDDGYRAKMVSTASRADLEELVAIFDSDDLDMLDDWLIGPEADAVTPTIEYVAVSALLMAAEEARYELQRQP